ncbi:MAG: hypothetical protein FJZ13_04970, partial [Candidatus Omnitrophica bacterium]|nr:hypothetical protein [Candidatus Omnitrophota bacterium]
MDKKDIYEHLATIYLDASLKKKKKKTKILPPLFNLPFFIFLFFIFGFTIILSAFINRNKSLDFQPSFVLQPAALKINFRFDPGPKETYSIA